MRPSNVYQLTILSFFTPQLLHKHTDTALVLFAHSAGLEACTTHTHAKISYLAKTGLFRKDTFTKTSNID